MFSGANEWLSEKPLHRVKTEVATWLSLNIEPTVSVISPAIKVNPWVNCTFICGGKSQLDWFGCPGLAEAE